MLIIDALRRWRRQRILKQSPISPEAWAEAMARLPLLQGLSPAEVQRLQELSILLMHEKSFEPARGLVLSREMVLHIALQACLPILNLGLQSYSGWVSIIVYPDAFMPQRHYLDEAGVEHVGYDGLEGEAWQRGPVILGWRDTEHAGELDGHNLVIHEFAHKLDMQNGAANGFPPLHRDMNRAEWVYAFSHAFEQFQQHCHGHHYHGIDCYAATAPAEFFAVFSEVFFERPGLIHGHFPEVYRQLCLYYRQDPLRRLGARP